MDQIGKRFQHDMELAGLAPRTQTHYLDAIRDYGKHFGRSPAELGHEDLRAWSKHLLDSGVGDGRLRQHFAALKFLYKRWRSRRPSRSFHFAARPGRCSIFSARRKLSARSPPCGDRAFGCCSPRCTQPGCD